MVIIYEQWYNSSSKVSKIHFFTIKTTNLDILISTKWLNSTKIHYSWSVFIVFIEILNFFSIVFISEKSKTFDKTHSGSWYLRVSSMIFNNFLHINTTFSVSASFNNIELKCIYFTNVPSKNNIFTIIIDIYCVDRFLNLIHVSKSNICFMFKRSNNHWSI